MANSSARCDVHALFDAAEAAGRVGLARKTRPVDVRPAVAGEVIETWIAGVLETRSRPAAAGDMVVRNRCPQTGNEQFLVSAAKFGERYEGPIGPPGPDGWRPYRPIGRDMRYFRVDESQGSFSFVAPWGEPMIAEPGDVIVRNPADPTDVYRIAAAAFECTYEVTRPA